jgi:peroxiredoxin Q/BCP
MLRVQNSYGKAVDFAQITKTGNYILLWFYPKASSPGCTVQGKRYAQLYGDSQKLNVVVFGVSHDPAREQCKFIEKMALEGGMLPDQDGSIARAFKVGGVFGFYNRDTILINPEGNIEMVWRGVNPFKDADIVYKYLKDKTGK